MHPLELSFRVEGKRKSYGHGVNNEKFKEKGGLKIPDAESVIKAQRILNCER